MTEKSTCHHLNVNCSPALVVTWVVSVSAGTGISDTGSVADIVVVSVVSSAKGKNIIQIMNHIVSNQELKRTCILHHVQCM